MTLPPTQSLSVQVPSGARCAVHGDRPAEFACTRCGNFACGECRHPGMEGQFFCSACVDFAAGDIPLEKRAELGLPRAVGLTVLGVLLKPWEFFAARSREQSLVPPFLFATVINTVTTLVVFAANAVTMDAQLAQLRDNPLLRNNPIFNEEWFTSAYSPAGQLGMACFYIVAYPFWYALVAGLQWVANWAVGARGASYLEVLRAILYFQATGLLMLLIAPVTVVLTLISPQVGGLAYLPYALFLVVWLVIAMWKVQRTEIWRPVLAQGLLAFFCCCLPYLGIMVAVVAMVGALVGR